MNLGSIDLTTMLFPVTCYCDGDDRHIASGVLPPMMIPRYCCDFTPDVIPHAFYSMVATPMTGGISDDDDDVTNRCHLIFNS